MDNASDVSVPAAAVEPLATGAGFSKRFSDTTLSALLGRPWDAVVVAILPLIVYVGSMSSYPDGWDTGEMQTVPWILGITHPTGFPLFVVGGWIFAHIVPISTVAWRLNFFCAVALVIAALAVRALAIGFGANRYVASVAALAFAMTGPVWQKAIHADVHALVVAFVLLALATLQRALVERSARWLTVSAALIGCAIADHLTAIWEIPILLLSVWLLRADLSFTARRNVAIAFFAPLLLYAYLPIRSAMIIAEHLDPNAGLPLMNTFGVAWGQFPVNSISGFWTMITGGPTVQHYGWVVLNLLAWPGYAVNWFTMMQAEVSVLVLVLGLFGVIVVGAKRPLLLVVVAGGFAAVPFAIAYTPNESDVMRYLLPSLGMTLALAAAAPTIVEVGLTRRVATAVFGIVLASMAWTQFSDHRSFYAYHDARGDQDAIDIVRDHVPEDAIVVSSWIDLTALAYGKYVDNSLGSKLIVGGWPSDMLPTFRALAKTRRVFVLADFVLQPNVADHVPPKWQHLVGSWSSRQLIEIVPTGKPPA